MFALCQHFTCFLRLHIIAMPCPLFWQNSSHLPKVSHWSLHQDPLMVTAFGILHQAALHGCQCPPYPCAILCPVVPQLLVALIAFWVPQALPVRFSFLFAEVSNTTLSLILQNPYCSYSSTSYIVICLVSPICFIIFYLGLIDILVSGVQCTDLIFVYLQNDRHSRSS